MKLKNENSSVHYIVFCLAFVAILIFSTGTSLCQNHISLTFNNCENYEDTCLFIGNTFIKNISEKKFEDLAYLFSDSILFRALIPSDLVTSTKPSEVTAKFKYWFYVEDPGKYDILDSNTEVMVDCLHIYYKIFRTFQGNSYNVEQHLYCEVASGKIEKLSLVCSGFRKLNI